MHKMFNLRWDELPEDLREEKIDAYIEAMAKVECKECGGTGEVSAGPAELKECDLCLGEGEVEPDTEDLHLRDEAEKIIRIHFPIYF